MEIKFLIIFTAMGSIGRAWRCLMPNRLDVLFLFKKINHLSLLSSISRVQIEHFSYSASHDCSNYHLDTSNIDA